MPKAIKKRVEKKVHKEEDIKETVIDIKERLKQRQRILVYVLAGFLVAAIAAIAIAVHLKTSKEKASEFEFEGYKLYYSDGLGMPPFERYQKALEMFKKSYAAKKTPQVLFYIANCNYELGSYDEAIKTLNDLNNQFSDPRINSLAYYKMAMAYLKKGEAENAINALKSLYSIKGATFGDMALLEWGKILETQGKTKEAKEKYKELINKFPKSALLEEAKKKAEDN